MPLDGDGSLPDLSLQGPFMGEHPPHPSVSPSQDGSAAVVEVHRFGEIADESVFMGLDVQGWPQSARTLLVERTLELAERGLIDGGHVLEADAEFEFTTETETGGGPETPDSSG